MQPGEKDPQHGAETPAQGKRAAAGTNMEALVNKYVLYGKLEIFQAVSKMLLFLTCGDKGRAFCLWSVSEHGNLLIQTVTFTCLFFHIYL